MGVGDYVAYLQAEFEPVHILRPTDEAISLSIWLHRTTIQRSLMRTHQRASKKHTQRNIKVITAT